MRVITVTFAAALRRQRELPASAAGFDGLPVRQVDSCLTGFSERSSRVGGIALIGALHVGFLLLLASSLQTHVAATWIPEIQARIINVSHPDSTPSLKLISPQADVIPAPDIRIETPELADTISAVDASQILAPRPDPVHHNVTPSLPGTLALQRAAQVVLRVLVLPDGSILQADIVTSSGQSRIDDFAAQYARAHWRYLPALLGDRPIQYWTTVIMRFG